jgi:hypothetical protein
MNETGHNSLMWEFRPVFLFSFGWNHGTSTKLSWKNKTIPTIARHPLQLPSRIMGLCVWEPISTREDLDTGMERDLRLETSEEGRKVEIDIHKILEQMGVDRERWPPEWSEAAEDQLKI